MIQKGIKISLPAALKPLSITSSIRLSNIFFPTICIPATNTTIHSAICD